MAVINPIYQYYYFGIYSLEMGKFLKDIFSGFRLTPTGDIINSQVFFGIPSAAFKFYQEKFNGQVLLPMVNFYVTDTIRKPQFERPNIRLWSKETYNPIEQKYEFTKAPMHFDINYSINIWNNTMRERDYMLHNLNTRFTQGETSLIYYPDYDNYPDVFLTMPIFIDGNFNDETEIEGLDVKETRDRIKTSFTLRCNALLPYKAYVPNNFDGMPIEYIDFESYINNYLFTQGNIIEKTKTLVNSFHKSARPETALIILSNPDINV